MLMFVRLALLRSHARYLSNASTNETYIYIYIAPFEVKHKCRGLLAVRRDAFWTVATMAQGRRVIAASYHSISCFQGRWWPAGSEKPRRWWPAGFEIMQNVQKVEVKEYNCIGRGKGRGTSSSSGLGAVTSSSVPSGLGAATLSLVRGASSSGPGVATSSSVLGASSSKLISFSVRGARLSSWPLRRRSSSSGLGAVTSLSALGEFVFTT